MATNPTHKARPWPNNQAKRRERVIDLAADGKKELEKVLARSDRLSQDALAAVALAYAALIEIKSEMIEARYGAPEE